MSTRKRTAEDHERVMRGLEPLRALEAMMSNYRCIESLEALTVSGGNRTDSVIVMRGKHGSFFASLDAKQASMLEREGMVVRGRTTGEFNDFLEWMDAMQKLREL